MTDLAKNHIAILLDRKVAFDFQAYLDPSKTQNTAVFSDETIKNLIELEAKRDESTIKLREGQTLSSMSSGERKVAVLRYLVSLNPQILVVENFYENLDAKNQEILKNIFVQLSDTTKIVQLVQKENELFPFVKDYYTVEDKQLIPYKDKVEHFFETSASVFSEFDVPKSTNQYTYDYKTFIKLSNVSIQFLDKKVLHNINWEIKLGEFWQLIGENGSGKTTLLSLITGDSPKAYGKDIVLFDKQKGTEENVWEIKQKIGYFTPNIAELFNRRHSVIHLVLSGFYDSIGLYVKPTDIQIKLAQEWLVVLGLSKKAKEPFISLPLSEQRMVLIARAMVKHPPLLILDEPTSSLAPEEAALVVALINKISKETKTTIIYVSHTFQKGLTPEKIFKLSKTVEGSVGELI